MDQKIPIVRLPSDSDEKWKSKQFHAIHSERVRVVPGIREALGQLSCSAVKSFDPIDQSDAENDMARHDGLVEDGTNRVLIASNQPNCTSCHVQHIKDKRSWGSNFLYPSLRSSRGLGA